MKKLTTARLAVARFIKRAGKRARFAFINVITSKSHHR